MAVDLFVQEENNIILNVDSNDVDLLLSQPVVTDIENDYNELKNKPSINNVTLIGDKSFEDLGLVNATEEVSGLMSPEDKEILDNISNTYVDWDHVDNALNDESNNPVSNKTLTHLFDRLGQDIARKQDALTFDTEPTEDSANPVTSDGIYDAIQTVAATIPAAQVNSDWNAESGVAQILNKPTIPTEAADVGAQEEPLVGQAYDSTASDYLTPVLVYGALGHGRQVFVRYAENETTSWLFTAWTRMVDAVDGIMMVMSQIVGEGSGVTLVGEAMSGQWLFAPTAIPIATSALTNDGADGTSTYIEADELAAVATSGDYDDLQNKPTIPAAQVNSDWNASSGVAEILNKPAIHNIPAGGNAGQVLKKASATDYDVHWRDETQIFPSGYSTTGGAQATKVINCSLWAATANTYLHILLGQANTNAGLIYFNVNGTGAMQVYINGEVSSATNYSLPAGSYIVFFDGTHFHVRTDGQLPSNIVGEAAETEAKLENKADSVGASANYAAKLTASIPYGKCDATSTSTVFTATIPGITELRDGVCFWLKNGVITSAANFTININGLGAKKSYNNMTASTQDTTLFNSAYTMLFVYDSSLDSGNGGYYCYRGYDSNTNTIGYQIRTNSYSLPMTSVTYRYRLLFTSADRQHFVPANNSTSTNATANRTVCQEPIDPLGPIVYYGTTASVAAGSRPSATALWQQYAITLGYSFAKGSALTMTAWKPVYLKCALQQDGSAIIDSTTPWVQDLPASIDGKLYIYLGVAYSATQIELTIDHPVYYYNGESIVNYDGHMAIKLLNSSFNISGSVASATLGLDSSLFKEFEFDVKGPRTMTIASGTYAERRRFKVPVSEGGFVISDYNFANVIMNDIAIYWSGTIVTNQNSTSPLLPGYTVEQIIGHF